MLITAGIDVGTSAIKVAVMGGPEGGGRARAGATILAVAEERVRRRSPRQVLGDTLARALKLAAIDRARVAYLATTGEGEACEERTGHFYSMTAHARGAAFLDPEARGAVDVGALHGRVIRFDSRAKVIDYRMTSQCASGSGQFLENIARYLGLTLEEIGAISLRSDRPEKISGVCAVLTETDVINMVSRGVSTANIVRGIHESIASRLVKLVKGVKVDGPVLMTGGLAGDVGLLAAMRDPALEVRTHADARYAGAIGAALWGAYRHERLSEVDAAIASSSIESRTAMI